MTPGRKVSIFVAGIAVMAALVFVLPVTDWLIGGLHWIDENQGIAWPLFIVAYVLATVLLLPGSVLTMGAGFLFPLPVGVILVSVSSISGASLAFLCGRFLARDWVAEKISGMQRFNALDRAISDSGLLIVFLTRLSPVFPFNLLNYALGLTGVRFLHYFLASWVGMLPGTVLYVYIGSAAKSLAALASGEISSGETSRYLLFAGLAATVILTGVLTRIATRALRTRLDAGEAEVDEIATGGAGRP